MADYDHLYAAIENSAYNLWLQQFSDGKLRFKLKLLVEKHMGKGVSFVAKNTMHGDLHICVPMQLVDGMRVLLRVAYNGSGQLAEEKANGEVAVLRYLKAKTTIPVPEVYYHGHADELPGGHGPFTIMQHIQCSQNLTTALNDVDRVLDDDNSREQQPETWKKLTRLYEQVADILLQLSQCEFSKIGALVEVAPGEWEAAARPLTFNMYQLVKFAGVSPDDLPTNVHDDAHKYFVELAELHVKHLHAQHHDLFRTEEEGIKQYASRKLLRDLAQMSSVAEPSSQSGPFKLWCDDLRGMSVLLDDACNVVGVVDLEFSYAAPVEFAHSPPWWLAGPRPERSGSYSLREWAPRYGRRLAYFLEVLERVEQERAGEGRLRQDQMLSWRMRASWETKDFWLHYAVRHGWALSGIYWEFLTERLCDFVWADDVEVLLQCIRELLGGEVETMMQFVRERLEQQRVHSATFRETQRAQSLA
ncbi:Aminoglycoside 3'-phosphotransferase/choline kinase domain protein [Pleurostoma richardsiae]|uniref:Aminoglycoside 3'-phosphotransferase/choline kinase domain protein n=1 Tax=Pleurostoma richardsiae TaxID=41990 RepID=A0AA38RQ89_9PEZI|nr:Aminoglycoside 3'-phosphotransferase/choline kinase domain protein [Pleurostoma richardsiae]